ncbi:hypothetical protein D6U17_00025 [Lactiplantibacillus pentosus]|uniref:Uncharacterized protein n=1 Tax=Lactiplantibacillus pentosus TaxID=1589 RepID=A0AB37RLM7_LACPE|nr:hypothetical protein ADS73_04935 [Lactiplantibacillus plantarum]RMW49296.1 hypothetical protein D6U20_01275 [Lactiplantibacillus pentosus]RMW49922.1 hypothetical protein D6U19_01135 [Lactiplantibacillus pentosus]RMW57248.1 hypothetical protein D6U21_02040 [Lactiplantibacillus pentosus]RMW57655.1 hypothetical protein D6U17_00025 [Lactiplantibacillus pentosus]
MTAIFTIYSHGKPTKLDLTNVSNISRIELFSEYFVIRRIKGPSSIIHHNVGPLVRYISESEFVRLLTYLEHKGVRVLYGRETTELYDNSYAGGHHEIF